jgi:hypothetical protein
MTITPDDNATTWRDVADELTAKERASLERLERETQGRAPAELLLDLARRGIAGRLADMAYCDVPAPAHATWVGQWEEHVELGWSRSLVWREYRGVAIDGNQQCDGTVVRGVSVYVEGERFTSAEARELAAALSEAADELDRLGAER